MLPDERVTIKLAQRGNREAFARLVRACQNRLFTSLALTVGCKTEAEEIVHEAFAQAYFQLSQLQGNDDFYTWIYRIARNVAAARCSRGQPSRSHASSPASTHQIAAFHDAHRTARAEQTDSLATALDELPDEFRTVLVMRELDGFDYRTIAELLDLDQNTVRKRVHLARVELRRIYSCLASARR